MIKKLLKIGGWSVAVLVGLLALVFVGLKLISDDQYKEWIVSATQSATGRDFSIDEFSVDLNTSLLVKANGVRMANAEWSDRYVPPCMLGEDLIDQHVVGQP